MPAPLATPDDVADIWRPLSSSEQTRAASLIAKASAMLRAACPFNVDDRITLSQTDPLNPQALDPEIVATVVAEIVKRVLVNPAGAASESETVGPYSKTSTFVMTSRSAGSQDPMSGTRGRLVVLASDIDALRPAVHFSPGFTVHTRPPHHRHLHGGYFPL